MALVLGVAGNRPYSVNVTPAQREFARERVHAGVDWYYGQGCTRVVTGMAMGPDQWAAMAAARNRLPFTAALPFPAEHHNRRWSDDAKEQYEVLLAIADEVYIEAPEFEFAAYNRRNEYVVARADEMLIVMNDRRKGGTWHAAQCTARHDKPGTLVLTHTRRTIRFLNGVDLAQALGVSWDVLVPVEEEAAA